MNVISHQYVNIDLEPMPVHHVIQTFQILLVIFITVEDSLSIVATLNNMLWLILDEKTSSRAVIAPLSCIIGHHSKAFDLF